MTRTYTNPIFDRSFPDPFVLKARGKYYAFSTGIQPDGRAFGVATSLDLINWTYVNGALEPLPPVRMADIQKHYTCYWAPEVTFYRGEYLMYYSVGFEDPMHIRLAIAQKPEGPYLDQGVKLTDEFDRDGKAQFAIDPHLFVDDDGKRYLFYATDFLHYSHIGTGTVIDRLLSPTKLEGRPRPISRAQYDWQVYDPQRQSKGGVKWHTIEGPFVLKHKDIYYEMFSAGNWQERTYGVSYATSNTILNDKEWEQYADGEKTMPILCTIPGKVIGPGHNSVIRGPNNIDLFCVYHEWSQGLRKLAIDELGFVGEQLIVQGPSDEPVPIPGLSHRISLSDTIEFAYSCFVLEVTLTDVINTSGEFTLIGAQGENTPITFSSGQITVGAKSQQVFEGSTVRVIANWQVLRILVDEVMLYTNDLASRVVRVYTPPDLSTFSSVELTYGFSDDFFYVKNLELLGYRSKINTPVLQSKTIVLEENSLLIKHRPITNAVLTTNFRFEENSAPNTALLFYPKWRSDEMGIEIEILRHAQMFVVTVRDMTKHELSRFEIAYRNNSVEFIQLRVLEGDVSTQIHVNNFMIAQLSRQDRETLPLSAEGGSSLALRASNGAIVLDLVRVVEWL